MNIGIIVHSHTGNTYFVAEKLKETLFWAGNSVTIEKLVAIDDKEQDVQKIMLKVIPHVGAYDALIFGAPVRGFSLSPVMAAYLSQISSLQGKKVACFVTEFFPYPWMGGNRAINQMKKICELKGTEVMGTGIVNWSRHRNEKITYIVKELSELF